MSTPPSPQNPYGTGTQVPADPGQPPYGPGPQAMPPASAPQDLKAAKNRATNKKTLKIIGYVLAVIIIFAIGRSSAGGSDAASAPSGQPSPIPTVTVTADPEPAPTVTVTETAAPAEEAPAAAAGPRQTFGEGIWIVGTDIAEGTYRTTQEVSADSMCYWEIDTAAGSSDIVQNDIPQGGIPTVNLAAGQQFSSTGCGDWQLQ